MKIVTLGAFIIVLFVGHTAPKCINPTHATEQVIRNAGNVEKTKTYLCAVKRSEKQNFNEQELCKNCGCYVGSHDDT